MLQQVVTNTLKTNDRIKSLSKEIGNIKKNLMVILELKKKKKYKNHNKNPTGLAR